MLPLDAEGAAMDNSGPAMLCQCHKNSPEDLFPKKSPPHVKPKGQPRQDTNQISQPVEWFASDAHTVGPSNPSLTGKTAFILKF